MNIIITFIIILVIVMTMLMLSFLIWAVMSHVFLFVSSAGNSHIPHCDDEKYTSDYQYLKFLRPLIRWDTSSPILPSIMLCCRSSDVTSCSNICCSAKIQKGELIRFIQAKSEECLLQLDEPEQSYYFWLIMERFCNQNGVSTGGHTELKWQDFWNDNVCIM